MKEISETYLVGELDAEQIDHLSRGLEHAHYCTLERQDGGDLWLESIINCGSVQLFPSRTVKSVWETAEALAKFIAFPGAPSRVVVLGPGEIIELIPGELHALE